jgi:predicted ATPase
LPRFLLLLGELAACLGEAGEVGSALEAVEEALARCETRDERWYFAELLRIKGELLLKSDSPDAVVEAEKQFLSSVDWARRQDALSWELRSAMSLARLQRERGRGAEARELISEVYGRFSEGFETADLHAAKQMLDTLA